MTKDTLFAQINRNKHKTVGIMIGFFLIVEAFAIFIGSVGGLSIESFVNSGGMSFLIAVCLVMPIIAFIYMTNDKSPNAFSSRWVKILAMRRSVLLRDS